MKRKIVFLGVLGVVFSVHAAQARAAIVVEAEVGGISNNTPGTAQFIAASDFTLPVPLTVFDPPGWATASVTGTGGSTFKGDVDFFSFVTTGGGAMFDMDNGFPLFDTIVSLFDGSGTLIAYGDDSPLDSGSLVGSDSFLGVISLSAGTYYVAVSQFGNYPSASGGVASALVRPDGLFGGVAWSGKPPGVSTFLLAPEADGLLAYTMHISLESAGAVPEPASMMIFWSLLGLASAGWGLLRRRRMK